MPKLILARDAGGPRYHLEGRAVHCGDLLELQMDHNEWQTLRIEGLPDAPRYFQALAGGLQMPCFPPDGAQFRWPARRLVDANPWWVAVDHEQTLDGPRWTATCASCLQESWLAVHPRTTPLDGCPHCARRKTQRIRMIRPVVTPMQDDRVGRMGLQDALEGRR
jgi:hypothetical protein